MCEMWIAVNYVGRFVTMNDYHTLFMVKLHSSKQYSFNGSTLIICLWNSDINYKTTNDPCCDCVYACGNVFYTRHGLKGI